MRNALTFSLSCTCFGDTVSLMLLSNCDCMARKLATVSCHLYDGNSLQGQKGNFLHRHSLYVVMKGKCVSLCMHWGFGFLAVKKKMLFTEMYDIPPPLSVTHTHIGTCARVISPVCDRRGERETQRRVFPLKCVQYSR